MMRIFIVIAGLTCYFIYPISAQSGIISNELANELILHSDSLRDEGLFDEARDMVDSAKSVFKRNGKWDEYIGCFDRLARIYDYEDSPVKRMNTIEEGLKESIKYQKENEVVVALLHRQKAEALIGLGKRDSVCTYIDLARNSFDYHKDWEESAWTLVLESVCAYYDQAFHGMEGPLIDALSLAEFKIEDSYELKSTVNQLLTVLFEEFGDVGKAISVGGKSLLLHRSQSQLSNEDLLFIVSTLENLGVLSSQLGDNKKAFSYFEEVKRILEGLPIPAPIREAMNRNSQASILAENSEFEKARGLYIENINAQLPNLSEAEQIKIASYQNLAGLYYDHQQFELAEKTILKAKTLHKDGGSSFQIERTYFLLGQIKQGLKKFTAATIAYNQSIDFVTRKHSASHPQATLARNHLGELTLLQQEPEKAIGYAQEAICHLVDSFSSPDVTQNPTYPVTMARKFLLQAFEVKRRALLMMHAQNPNQELLENAFVVSQLSVVLLDSMRQDLQEDNSQQKLMARSMEVYEGGIELAWQLYQEDPDETYLTKAFEISEKSKAILLLRQFRREEAIEFGNIPTHLLQREKTLRLEILYYESQLFEENSKSDPSGLRISNWQQTVFHLKEDYRQLMDTVAIISPEYHRIKHDTRVVSVAYVQQKLPPAGAWLQYFEGKSYRYVFGISANGVRLHRVGRDDQQVLDFVAGMSHPEYAYDPVRFANWTATGHSLYQDLVGAVIGSGIQHLTIVPDGVLSFLPFEVLLREAVPATALNYQQLPYLLRDFVIGYDYSATLHAKGASAVGRRKKGPLAGFAPIFSPGLAMAEPLGAGIGISLADLRYNQKEIQRIASMAGGSMYLGKAATESTFRKDAPGFQILHLATHALTNDENPWLSGLAFATEEGEEDGFLHAFEICQMEIPAQLAVLSACNTAKGTLRPGTGVRSLAWAFKYAGCPSIVMSQWQVDDAATHDIMSDLYRYLREGKTTAVALRQAKLDFLDDAVRVHPYYWSAFVYLGQEMPLEWERPWYQKPPYWIALLLLAVSFLAGAIRLSNRN